MKTKVVHSLTKSAWNVVADQLGAKFKIARCPYVVTLDVKGDKMRSDEAFNDATFISYCFNNKKDILNKK